VSFPYRQCRADPFPRFETFGRADAFPGVNAGLECRP
jgi:hypothetical protein